MCRQFMYRLGIDLGGTNIVAGVVDENYEIIAKASCKTNVPRPESEICDSMADVALKAIEKQNSQLMILSQSVSVYRVRLIRKQAL